VLTFLKRPRPAVPRLLTERGQGFALLLLALAGLFLLVLSARGMR